MADQQTPSLTRAQLKEMFLSELKDIFGFLIKHGFRFREETVEDTPMYLSAAYCGENVAFVFDLDIVDQRLSFSVQRVSKGKLVNPFSKGGYNRLLNMYLIHALGYRTTKARDSLLGDRPMREKIREVLESQADVLKTDAAILLSDKTDVLNEILEIREYNT